MRRLRRVVCRLHWEPPAGVWVDYGVGGAYDERDAARKAAFVETVAHAAPG